MHSRCIQILVISGEPFTFQPTLLLLGGGRFPPYCLLPFAWGFFVSVNVLFMPLRAERCVWWWGVQQWQSPPSPPLICHIESSSYFFWGGHMHVWIIMLENQFRKYVWRIYRCIALRFEGAFSMCELQRRPCSWLLECNPPQTHPQTLQGFLKVCILFMAIIERGQWQCYF